MLKIYGNTISPPCVKVRFACELLGLDYKWQEMDFRSGELKKPEFLAIHPAGKVPAMDDNGFKLFESEAIIRYLCEKEGNKSLYPQELEARAITEQWSHFNMNHVGLSIAKVVFNRVIAPMFNIEIDENSLKEGLEWTKRYLPIVDQRLSESTYIAGDELTIADLSLLSVLDRAEQADYSLVDHKHLSSWRSKLQAMDFWKVSHGVS